MVRPQLGWGFCTPTADLENAFEPGGKRKAGTILYRSTVTPAGDSISTQNSNPRYNRKAYVPNSVTKVCGYGRGQNIRILRYVEALLLHAEATNKLGQSAKAIADVDQVRQRASLGPLPPASAKTACAKLSGRSAASSWPWSMATGSSTWCARAALPRY